jgi:hypothetical protein
MLQDLKQIIDRAIGKAMADADGKDIVEPTVFFGCGFDEPEILEPEGAPTYFAFWVERRNQAT